ncbi:MAG: copper chaperone PCu(A)C [Dehalococcoidia bacterium]
MGVRHLSTLTTTGARATAVLAVLGALLSGACAGTNSEPATRVASTPVASTPVPAAKATGVGANVGATSVATTAATAPAATLRVRDAWARSTAGNPNENTAVYMVIENRGVADRLVGAAITPSISRAVELHVTEESGGQMVMRPVAGWDVPANGGMLELKPAGNHVMVIGLEHQLKAGDTLALTLTFEKAGAVHVEAPVRDAAGSGGMMMPK